MVDVKIDILCSSTEHLYIEFIKRTEASLFYHTLKYRDFLNKTCDSATSLYFVAIKDDKIIAVLPLFILTLDNGLSIINSLPFYGSHGGILISNDVENRIDIINLFLNKLLEVSKKENCLVFTIVDSPFSSMGKFYEAILNIHPEDQRISQVTNLTVNNNCIESELMEKFHSKTRNMVRKSLKQGFNININNTYEGFKQIHHFHLENMLVIGGNPKPLSVFEAMHEIFRPHEDYNIYIAEKNNDFSAGLLVFYFGDYCEYFTPVINNKYRNQQPLSCLIFTAMKDACKRGIKYWNWGGTWPNGQDGVHLFKKRWGANEKIYNYYTKILDENSLSDNMDFCRENFPYFYIKNLRAVDDNTV